MEEYQKIVEKYQAKAMAMAINILNNREDAEDVCQEAFIRVYQNLDKFDFQRNFKDWFYAILYNQCIDFIRKKRRFYRLFEKKKEEVAHLHAASSNSNPSGKELLPKSLLQKLSPKERTAVFLWAAESSSSKEIASVLGCTASTARVHLFRARKKIKKILEKENG